MARPIKHSNWAGSAVRPLDWDGLVALVTSLFSLSEDQTLSSSPSDPNILRMEWADAEDISYRVGQLSDIREPYETGRAVRMSVSGRTSDLDSAFVNFSPRDPRPRVAAMFNGQPDAVDKFQHTLSASFPHHFDGSLVFLSWGGASSKRVAESLHVVLDAHLPGVEVFFSPASIDPGDDPLQAHVRRRSTPLSGVGSCSDQRRGAEAMGDMGNRKCLGDEAISHSRVHRR